MKIIKLFQDFWRTNCFVSRFSAFSKRGDNSRYKFGTVLARGDSRVRGSGGFGHLQSRGIIPMSSMEQEKEALAAVRWEVYINIFFVCLSKIVVVLDLILLKYFYFFKLTLICYRDQIRERRREHKLNKLEAQNNSKSSLSTAKELTEEEMEKETKIILTEYLHLQNIKVL